MGQSTSLASKSLENAKHALELDKQNGNTYWQDAMKLEVDLLKDFKAFKILEKGVRDFPNKKNYTFVPLNMVFDVRFDLRRHVRIVAEATGRINPTLIFIWEWLRLKVFASFSSLRNYKNY